MFFNVERGRLLQDWLSVRKRYAREDSKALFVTTSSGKVERNQVYDIVIKHAERVGMHDLFLERIEGHLTPHCLRHWFTTQLRRNGMTKETVS